MKYLSIGGLVLLLVISASTYAQVQGSDLPSSTNIMGGGTPGGDDEVPSIDPSLKEKQEALESKRNSSRKNELKKKKKIKQNKNKVKP
jgi:hypothetical protein